MMLVKRNLKEHMSKEDKEWLSTKEAIQLFKSKNYPITIGILNYLSLSSKIVERTATDGIHRRFSRESISGYIQAKKNKPNKKIWIRVIDLAKKLHVHKSRIYSRLKTYNSSCIKYFGTTYVNKQEFLKKYKEEYNGNTDGRKKARN